MPKNIKNSNRKHKQRSPKLIMIWLMLMVVFIGELLFYTWCRVQYTRTKYDIAKQVKSVQQLSAMRDNLKIELARLKSPRRIAKIAREQLGLISPSAKQTIVMPQK
jgi:cell division protein FtsL